MLFRGSIHQFFLWEKSNNQQFLYNFVFFDNTETKRSYLLNFYFEIQYHNNYECSSKEVKCQPWPSITLRIHSLKIRLRRLLKILLQRIYIKFMLKIARREKGIVGQRNKTKGIKSSWKNMQNSLIYLFRLEKNRKSIVKWTSSSRPEIASSAEVTTKRWSKNTEASKISLNKWRSLKNIQNLNSHQPFLNPSERSLKFRSSIFRIWMFPKSSQSGIKLLGNRDIHIMMIYFSDTIFHISWWSIFLGWCRF